MGQCIDEDGHCDNLRLFRKIVGEGSASSKTILSRAVKVNAIPHRRGGIAYW